MMDRRGGPGEQALLAVNCESGITKGDQNIAEMQMIDDVLSSHIASSQTTHRRDELSTGGRPLRR
jgi:hypothetical protein